MQLLDRDRELDELSAALADATDGRGSVVLVTGEAGIGKTSLLRTFVSGVNDGIRVLQGACEDLTVPEPLGPLHDLLDESALRLSDELAGTERHFSVYAGVFADISDRPEGTVVVIEDLHWADDATVDFVRFVARRIADRRLLLVVSSRAELARNRQLIRRAFGDLPSGVLRRVGLSPLSAEAVAELCRRDSRDPDSILKASGGNAFYVTELLRNEGESLPASIRDAVLARVDKLGEGARAVLEAVSIVPRRTEIALLEAVLGSDIQFEEEVETCLNAGLLLTDGENLNFQHEIAREAVASSLSPLKTRALHKRFLEQLTKSGTVVGLSRRLHHARGAGDNAAVAELAPRAAAAAAAVGSRKEASAFYALSVEALGEQSGLDLLEQAAWWGYTAGEHLGAAGYQERAIELIDAGTDPIRKGDAFRKLSRYRWVRSDYAGAFSAIEKAIEILSNHRGPELAYAYSSFSQLLMTGYRHDEVEAPARIAIDLAREFDRPDIVAHALNNIGMAHTHTDKARGREILKESLEISRTLEDPDHTARLLSNWMHLEFHTCDFREALECAEESATFAEEHEMDAYRRYGVGMMARAKHQLGQWDEAISLANRAFDPDDRVPANYNFNGAMAFFIHQVRAGEPLDENVVAYLDLYDRPDAEQQRIGFIAEAKAEHAWLTGEDIDRAIERLQMVTAKTDGLMKVAGACVWLNRLGADPEVDDLSTFTEPYRLELAGDFGGAARAWAVRGARYEQALSLAFGTSDQQAEALSIFDEIGAEPAAGKLRAVLGKPAQPKRGRPRSTGPHGLTGRQMDVLRLLGEGMTNGQIGEKLFISAKTVDHHVSAILAQLGASSRGEAAAIARKLDLI